MSKIVVQGIPYDEKSSFLQGPSLAPPLIREAYHSPSANYYAENGTLVSGERLVDKGDFDITDCFEIEVI